MGVSLDEVTANARHENFPVASRFLPRRQRDHLMAIYAYARMVDDIGDDLEGDRLAALTWFEAELGRAFAGQATHPVFVRLQRSIDACGFTPAPFHDLIEANRRDQSVRSYATFAELLDYCTVSANPVGRLVLRVFDADTPTRIAWSDDVCSGLQIVEHLQDVGEDAARGRVYLPADDLESEGCTVNDLSAATAPPALRRVVAREAARARTLLASAAPLARSLSGRAGLAIAGFGGGGLAALDAIEAAGYDVLGNKCRPTKTQTFRRMWQLRAGSAA